MLCFYLVVALYVSAFVTDNYMFAIEIRGQGFNTTLTRTYIRVDSIYNISFDVPISKYMPDMFINLIFR